MVSPVCFNGAAVHHGGVACEAFRQTRVRNGSFNGAAVHHGGVAGVEPPEGTRFVVSLQWGRRSSRRSGSTWVGRWPRGARASMGPPFITAEWTRAQLLRMLG